MAPAIINIGPKIYPSFMQQYGIVRIPAPKVAIIKDKLAVQTEEPSSPSLNVQKSDSPLSRSATFSYSINYIK